MKYLSKTKQKAKIYHHQQIVHTCVRAHSPTHIQPTRLGGDISGSSGGVRAYRHWSSNLLQCFSKEVLWVGKSFEMLYWKRVVRTEKFEKRCIFYFSWRFSMHVSLLKPLGTSPVKTNDYLFPILQYFQTSFDHRLLTPIKFINLEWNLFLGTHFGKCWSLMWKADNGGKNLHSAKEKETQVRTRESKLWQGASVHWCILYSVYDVILNWHEESQIPYPHCNWVPLDN